MIGKKRKSRRIAGRAAAAALALALALLLLSATGCAKENKYVNVGVEMSTAGMSLYLTNTVNGFQKNQTAVRLYVRYSFTTVNDWKPKVSFLNYSLFTRRCSLHPVCPTRIVFFAAAGRPFTPTQIPATVFHAPPIRTRRLLVSSSAGVAVTHGDTAPPDAVERTR